MNTTIFIVIVLILLINSLQPVALRSSQKTIKECLKYIKESNEYIKILEESNDVMFWYCLIQILNKSIKDEDFETAAKVRELMLKLNKSKV